MGRAFCSDSNKESWLGTRLTTTHHSVYRNELGCMLALDDLLAAFFLDALVALRASDRGGDFQHGKADGF